jgi:hypothetical protein
MSSDMLRRAKISIPIFIVLVVAAITCFLVSPSVSIVNGFCAPVTLPATNITVNSATLHGEPCAAAVDNLFRVKPVFAFPEGGFVWGTSPGGPYPNNSLAQISGLQFYLNVTNLLPGTTYYYKVYIVLVDELPGNHAVFAEDDDGIYEYGNEVSFTTLGRNLPGNPLTSGDAGISIGTPAEVNFNYINVQPTVASVNQPVTVVANVANSGTLEGGFTANLQINGQIEQTKMGTVAGNTYVPVEFTIVKDTPGTYNVDIGGQTTSFTVVAAGNTAGSNALSQSQIMFIAIGVLAIAVIGLITAMILRRRSGY